MCRVFEGGTGGATGANGQEAGSFEHDWCRAASGCPEPGKVFEVIGCHRGPDVSLEVIEPAPGAARQAVGGLQAGYAGLDARAEVSKFAIDPAAPDHILDLKAAL